MITVTKKKPFFQRLKKDFQENWIRYIMILPPIYYMYLFEYKPVYGLLMAFQDFKIKKGVWGSEWVGMENFLTFFNNYNFWTLIKNTLTLSIYSLVIGFPIPIVFALMLNYVKSTKLKKAVQMVSYAPHFISIVIICGMISIFCKPDTGIFNVILKLFGGESINFLAEPDLFKHIYVWSGVWQGLGWSAIVYMSALSGVDPQLHEAAIIDGATKIQRMFYVDLPSIKSTIVMLLILRLGSLMSVGFEKAFLLSNSLNQSKASIISTYTYRLGMVRADYSMSTAVGLFNQVINLILVLTANYISKKVAEEGLI